MAEELTKINAALSTNPYNDVLSYKSTKEGEFFKDSDGDIVNRYQKPLGLYLHLLKMFALPGTLVLDATCGTGSLELAAMEKEAPSGLEFVAFERNAYQAKNCLARLQQSCCKPTSEHDVMLDVIAETHGNASFMPKQVAEIETETEDV